MNRCVLLVVGLLLSVLGCGDDPVAPPVATTITLSATSVSFVSLGETQQINASVLDQRGTTMSGAVVSWASSNAQVAVVSVTGLVTAVENGSATITASLGSASPGTALVTISQRAFAVTLAPDSLVLIGSGDTATITADVRDAGDARIVDPTITWVSSDVDVVTISPSGIATSVAPGLSVISALASHGGATVVGLAGLVVYDSLRITTSSLPVRSPGSGYQARLEATGGDGSYAWTLLSGFLPFGLQLDPGGLITGTATGGSRQYFVVEVTSAGQSAERQLSIGICDSFGCR